MFYIYHHGSYSQNNKYITLQDNNPTKYGRVGTHENTIQSHRNYIKWKKIINKCITKNCNLSTVVIYYVSLHRDICSNPIRCI